jgi:hypothetical protein
VIVESTAAATEEDAPEFPDGSDVHDVESLERQLDREAIDAMVRDYLSDDAELPPVPPLPRGSRLRGR